MPGAPDELRAAGVGENHAVVRAVLDAARAAAVKQEGEREEVGGVEASDADGKDVVERDGGAEADKREQDAYGGGYGDAVNWKGGAAVELEFWGIWG